MEGRLFHAYECDCTPPETGYLRRDPQAIQEARRLREEVEGEYSRRAVEKSRQGQRREPRGGTATKPKRDSQTLGSLFDGIGGFPLAASRACRGGCSAGNTKEEYHNRRLNYD
jgi:hypothetical protein